MAKSSKRPNRRKAKFPPWEVHGPVIPPSAATMAMLRAMSIEELDQFYDAAHAAHAGWMSLYNQPRVDIAGRGGRAIEGEMVRVDQMLAAIYSTMAKRRPKSPEEWEQWGSVVIGRAVWLGDHVDEAAAAIELVRAGTTEKQLRKAA